MYDLGIKESSEKWEYNLGFISILVEYLDQKHTINNHQINVILFRHWALWAHATNCIFFINLDMNGNETKVKMKELFQARLSSFGGSMRVSHADYLSSIDQEIPD